MISDIEQARRSSLDLLDQTRRATRSALSSLDPELVVNNDERAWRVRDVVGHLAVWNGEAARSLSAHAMGAEYFCITASTKYDEYNGPAADERSTWRMEQVWAEYEASHEQLKKMVEQMPVERWDREMVYPWSERGTTEMLIKRMMKHEKIDHCDPIIGVASK